MTTPSYVRASPSVEHLPELQPVLGYRAALVGGAPSRLSFTPLTTSCWVTSGHYLHSAELKPSALGLILCCDEGDDIVTAVVAIAAATNAYLRADCYFEHFTGICLLNSHVYLMEKGLFLSPFYNDKTEAQRAKITLKISHRSGTARI